MQPIELTHLAQCVIHLLRIGNHGFEVRIEDVFKIQENLKMITNNKLVNHRMLRCANSIPQSKKGSHAYLGNVCHIVANARHVIDLPEQHILVKLPP